jgi:hypothetical protein
MTVELRVLRISLLVAEGKRGIFEVIWKSRGNLFYLLVDYG